MPQNVTLKQEDSPWLEGSNFPVALKLCAANHFLTYLLVVPQLSQREREWNRNVGGQVVAWGTITKYLWHLPSHPSY